MKIASPYDIIIRPVITEDSTASSQTKEPQYVFQVLRDANKIEIARAIEEVFGVEVKSVNTLRQKGKPKRMRQRREGRRAEVKKAFVTLKAGQTIDLF